MLDYQEKIDKLTKRKAKQVTKMESLNNRAREIDMVIHDLRKKQEIIEYGISEMAQRIADTEKQIKKWEAYKRGIK